jgi:hypothetical protein
MLRAHRSINSAALDFQCINLHICMSCSGQLTFTPDVTELQLAAMQCEGGLQRVTVPHDAKDFIDRISA